MSELYGYADPLSCRPGDRVRFMISADHPGPFEARVVRLFAADFGPRSPLREAEINHVVLPGLFANTQPTAIGSFGRVAKLADIGEGRVLSLVSWVYPTVTTENAQTIISLAQDEGCISLALRGGEAVVVSGRANGGGAMSYGPRLANNRWTLLSASIDFDNRTVRFAAHAWSPRHGFGVCESRIAGCEEIHRPGRPSVVIGARQAGQATGDHFNGKLEAPSLYVDGQHPTDQEIRTRATMPTEQRVPSLLAKWNFATDITGNRFSDLGPQELHGTLVNCPARAVTGRLWNGTVFDWRFAPEHYAAVHFHDDDIADAKWTPTVEIDLPADLASGVYAAKLWRSDGEPTYIPFFVSSAEPRSGRAAILMSTATYIAYGNQVARLTATQAERVAGASTVVSVSDLALLRHPEFGASTYDTHRDGSGIVYASRKRPLLNLKPSGRPWNFALDLCLVDFLDQHDIAADIVTDEQLHEDGNAVLDGYDLLITGCHPEYVSSAMLDALEHFVRRGGRLMYLGGNGFYWRIAFSQHSPGVLEVRRGLEGTRLWTGAVGEGHHSFDGEPGGTWRSLGRPPNVLAGVGYVAQGFDCAAPYRRTEVSRHPRASFIFEGVDEDVFGKDGIVYGGAAGLEIDCTNESLGTPPHALVVASSFGHSNAYVLSVDEIEVNASGSDATIDPRVRAEITFYETQAGGAVFSVGSIAYLGALAETGCATVRRMTLNVVKRFLDPTPFDSPKMS